MSSIAGTPRQGRSHAHDHDLGPFTHAHAFADEGAGRRAGALTSVTVITLVTMVIELAAGYWSGSLALTADGWHMGTHAVALGGAALAYRLSRRADSKEAYAFGGWKIEVLSGYSSGLLLMVVSLWLIYDSVRALIFPEHVDFGQALIVAVLGLVVNLVSAWVLARGGDHGHAHGHGHTHDHDHDHDHDDAREPGAVKLHDHNFNAAYVHVLADLFTSVLAVLALGGGLWLGWRFLDPLVALLGAAVIGKWSLGVLSESARALVDASNDPRLAAELRRLVESDGDAKIADLHVWQVGTSSFAAIVSIVADHPLDPMVYRQRLAVLPALKHVTVEVHRCPTAPVEAAPAS